MKEREATITSVYSLGDLQTIRVVSFQDITDVSDRQRAIDEEWTREETDRDSPQMIHILLYYLI